MLEELLRLAEVGGGSADSGQVEVPDIQQPTEFGGREPAKRNIVLSEKALKAMEKHATYTDRINARKLRDAKDKLKKKHKLEAAALEAGVASDAAANPEDLGFDIPEGSF